MDFADKLGVSEGAVRKWESDLATPRYRTLGSIAELGNVTVGYLLSGEAVNGDVVLMGAVERTARLLEEYKQRIVGPPQAAASALQDQISLPVLGRVPAGDWSEAITNAEASTMIPSKYVPESVRAGSVAFILEVEGESMVGAGIMPGDSVLIEKSDSVEHGQIAVVQVNGEVTLKRVWLSEGKLYLMPENPAMQPFPVPEGARVVGRVRAVYRLYA